MRKEWEDEFAAWARSRQGALLRAAVLLTGDEALAQDLVQEALVEVADRWGRLREERPEAYARRILYRDAVSAWRRTRRYEVREQVPDRALRDAAQTWTEGAEVRQALLELTRKQRAVLVLRYYEDLSEMDIAAALGVGRGTVKSQAHVGLRRLREVLEVQDRENLSASKPQGGGSDGR